MTRSIRAVLLVFFALAACGVADDEIPIATNSLADLQALDQNQAGEPTPDRLCGSVDAAARSFATTLGREVSGTEHASSLDEVYCKWVAPDGVDFIDVTFAFDEVLFEAASGAAEPYDVLGLPALELGGEILTVRTPGGWSIEVAGAPAAGYEVEQPARDLLMMSAVAAAGAAGG